MTRPRTVLVGAAALLAFASCGAEPTSDGDVTRAFADRGLPLERLATTAIPIQVTGAARVDGLWRSVVVHSVDAGLGEPLVVYVLRLDSHHGQEAALTAWKDARRASGYAVGYAANDEILAIVESHDPRLDVTPDYVEIRGEGAEVYAEELAQQLATTPDIMPNVQAAVAEAK